MKVLFIVLPTRMRVSARKAADAVQDYLRMGNPEDGFSDQILPTSRSRPQTLIARVTPPTPVVIIDIEPESAGAYHGPLRHWSSRPVPSRPAASPCSSAASRPIGISPIAIAC